MHPEARWRLLVTGLLIVFGLVTVSFSLFRSHSARLLAVSSALPFQVFEPVVLNQLGPTPTATPSATTTASATPTPIATKTATSTGARTPTPTATATTTTSAGSPVFFPVGPGYSDVVPHQILRANNDRLYLFAAQPHSTTIRTYWTSAAGLPNSQADFDSSATVTAGADPISVEAVGDGGHFVHVLSNLNNGELRDYPFNLNTGAFGSSVLLVSGDPTITGDYIGSSGLSAMLDLSNTLQLAYWSAGNHITYRAYSVDTTTGALTLNGGPTQVDTGGSANHPSVAVSPLDNSLTVAWVSQTTSTAQILARSRTSSGAWGNIESVSAAPVWTSVNFGLNIDQGPSLLIDSSGTQHLTYIENFDSTGDYGHIHYVVNIGSGWVDTALDSYSHDPALALNSAGDLYIIGHGHPQSKNTVCTTTDDMCTIKKSGASWGSQKLFAAPPSGQSFDSSPSVKWSVVGLNRPETIEFLFFMTPYASPTLYYARLP
jgi:hypothetical protein